MRGTAQVALVSAVPRNEDYVVMGLNVLIGTKDPWMYEWEIRMIDNKINELLKQMKSVTVEYEQALISIADMESRNALRTSVFH